MRYKLLVFDWDGTIMDSEATIVACLQAAIGELQLEPRTLTELKNIIGLGLREAVDTLYPNQEDGFTERMVAAYRYYFLGDHRPPPQLFAGVEPLLTQLNQAGYLLAVATGKGRRGLDHELDRTGLRGQFVTSRCADESFSKPHPQMLQEIMAFCGCEPAEVLMIGDTAYDMAMAQNAGVDGLAVTYGVHTREQLQPYAPVGWLDELPQLAGWLGLVD